MTRWLPRSLLVPLILSASVGGAATESTPADPSDPNSSAPPARSVSPAVAELLRAAAPKFAEPPETPPATSSMPAEPDRPRNGIIRLPRYLVEEPKIFLPNHRDVLTARGRLELALKRHPGLRVGNLWIFRNDGIGLFMLYEEERLERLRELHDLMSLLPSPLRTGAVEETYQILSMRPADWTRRSRSAP